MSSEDPSDSLAKLGDRVNFGEYEVDAYLAVLRHGKLSAAEIANQTAIPQPRVYDTVRSLANKGFVELRDSRPLEVLAIDPDEAFAGVKTTLDDLLGELEQQYSSPSRDGEAVSLVTSRQTILRYLEDVISRSEYELVLSLTPDLLDRVEEQLAQKRAAGVTVELLLSPEANVAEPDEFDYEHIATTTHVRRGVTTPVVAVADGKYSLYTTRIALQSDADGYGVVFDRSGLGLLVLGFLNTAVWPSSNTLVEAEADPQYPRRYATVRRCARDLQNADGTLYATVEGRHLLNGDRLTVAGEITDFAVTASQETAAITLDTGAETLGIGGKAAAFEDIEAHKLAIARGSPPDIDATQSLTRS